jgi:hypothetical protein
MSLNFEVFKNVNFIVKQIEKKTVKYFEITPITINNTSYRFAKKKIYTFVANCTNLFSACLIQKLFF